MSEGARLKAVPIFAAGNHRGKDYTVRDLDDIVDNFKRFSSGRKPKLRVPAVIGHEENQEFLENTGIPAAAWPERVWRNGKTLFADLAEIPRQVARLLKGKAYRTVSAEIYDEPPEGVPGRGKMLRRIAFLGGEIPQVKSLDEIPTVEEHSEQRRPSPLPAVLNPTHAYSLNSVPGVWACFSEVRRMAQPSDDISSAKAKQMLRDDSAQGHPLTDKQKGMLGAAAGREDHAEGEHPMSHDEMIEYLAKCGINRDHLAKLDDAALADFVRVLDTHQHEDDADEADEEMGEENGAEHEGQEKPTAEEEADAEHAEDELDGGTHEGQEHPDSQEEEAAEMAEDGEPVSEDRDEMKSRAEKFMARACKMYASYADTEPGTEIEEPEHSSYAARRVRKHSEGRTVGKKTVPMAQVARERQLLARERELAKRERESLQKFREETHLAEKTRTVEQFVESRIAAGKILPAQRDAVTRRLLRADGRAVVQKFKEGKAVVALTELDLQMREIDATPAFKFGERVKGKAGSREEAASADEAKLAEHFETFAEVYASQPHGMTKEKLIDGFKKEKARRPELTADEYLHN